MDDGEVPDHVPILPFHHPFDIDRTSAISNSGMAPIEPLYRAIGSEETLLHENEETHNLKPKSKCPRISTVVLSITTIIFGLQDCACPFALRYNALATHLREGMKLNGVHSFPLGSGH
jgi:hypothetical protein